ncbi:MAG: hypothetical protein ACREND_08265 [Gemmatimonadaceae bacterium]
MTELFDTSSIPDEPTYWDTLAFRIASATPHRRSGVLWVGSRGRSWLAAACVAAGISIAIATATALTGSRRPNAPPGLVAALAPNDPLGRALVAANEPPLAALPMGAARPRSAP